MIEIENVNSMKRRMQQAPSRSMASSLQLSLPSPSTSIATAFDLLVVDANESKSVSMVPEGSTVDHRREDRVPEAE